MIIKSRVVFLKKDLPASQVPLPAISVEYRGADAYELSEEMDSGFITTCKLLILLRGLRINHDLIRTHDDSLPEEIKSFRFYGDSESVTTTSNIDAAIINELQDILAVIEEGADMDGLQDYLRVKLFQKTAPEL